MDYWEVSSKRVCNTFEGVKISPLLEKPQNIGFGKSGLRWKVSQHTQSHDDDCPTLKN